MYELSKTSFHNKENCNLITKQYKEQDILYKHEDNKKIKKFIQKKIDGIKKKFSKFYHPKDKDYNNWIIAEGKLKQHSLFSNKNDLEVLKKLKEDEKRLNKIWEQKRRKIYSNAFEYNYEFPEVLNDEGKFVGFDIVIGNPPYIQLQRNKGELANKYEKCNYETFSRTGDIYCLFYERGYKLLKERGRLCFITSNKWMRSGYGGKLKKFFEEKTNPELLIDLAGIKIFDLATVDTNILMFSKDENQKSTQACVLKNTGKNLSCLSDEDFFDHNINASSILTPIEQSIKNKIEKFGVLLKIWVDLNIIQINRGILTGFDNAFMISRKKRDDLIEQDPKSEKILRPILRGRNIKRYEFNFADLWLINAHNGIKEKNIKHIDINDYFAIKKHLDEYFELNPKKRNRSDKGYTEYNLRPCVYLDNFDKPKIIYQELQQFNNGFAFDSTGKYFVLNSGYMITGNLLKYLLALLNSKFIQYCFRRFYAITLGEKGTRWKHDNIIKLPIVKPTKGEKQEVENLLINKNDQVGIKDERAMDRLIYQLYKLNNEEIKFIEEYKME